ncbi:TVP38/TMEM64 family protein [Streptomyces sp. NPDC090025]|uniref:TVP38/TMEM64 family protein n=1 Tax=Streptomyces sp. NPDC090025 TaxID=3365922 RepID=UPI003835A298
MFEPVSVRRSRGLLSPKARLTYLAVILVAAGVCVLLFEPQRLLAAGWPPQLSGAGAMIVFGVAYGVCTAALVPRPILNLAAGALFGAPWGIAVSLGGTIVGAALSFLLGRALGQDALRPYVRGRWLKAADGQLTRHGFRSMLAIRLFPGMPFQLANYAAAVSRMKLFPFLLATGLGSVPNTAAYVIAGSEATSPTSPAFLIATGFIVLSAAVAAVVAWRKRHRISAHADRSAREHEAAETATVTGAEAEAAATVVPPAPAATGSPAP